MLFPRSSEGGQSIVEVLVAVAVGAIFVIGAATIIAPSLQISKQSGLAQSKSEIAAELLNNVKTWSASNWNGLLALATSSANPYFLNTSSSPFTVTTGTETVFVGTSSSTRYFYFDDVYRDSSGNVSSTAAGNSYDLSTKQITVVVTGTRNGAPTSTVVSYFTRNGSNVFDQTDWSGGSGFSGPTTVTNNRFVSSAKMNTTSTPGSLTASAPLAGGYIYYRSITVTSSVTAASGTNSNFPMLVSSTISSWKTTGNGGNVQNLCTAPNGVPEPCDLIFATSSANCNATPLNFETESYTSSTGALVTWVNVPSLSAGTAIYACYGNSSITTDQSHPSSTWNSNFKGVYHFPNGTILNASDSTSNFNDGVITAATATSSGEVDGAAAFNGASTIINLNQSSGLPIYSTSSYSISFWVNAPGGCSNGNNDIFTEGSGHAGRSLLQFLCGTAGSPPLQVFLRNEAGATLLGANSTAAVMNSGWIKVDWTDNNGTANLYVNGAKDATNFNYVPAGSFTMSNDAVGAIYRLTPIQYLSGSVDELELASSILSPSWILTEYSNQSNPSTFYAVGNELPVASAGISASSSLHWAWNDAIGWIDFYNTNTVGVGSAGLSGYASSSAGDISFDCATSRIGNICNSGPWANGYTYRRTISASGALVAPSGTSLSNFPMLISGTYSYLAASSSGGKSQAGGGSDIIFTSDAGGTSRLSFEQESYTSSTGAINYWVKVPTLSSSSNNIYMFYGNATATTTQNATGTWDINYKSVYHYSDTAATTVARESTSNNNQGALQANASARTTSTAIAGSALVFNGGGDYMSFTTTTDIRLPAANSPFTFTAWIKTTATDASILGGRDLGNSNPVLDLQLGSNGVDNSGTGKLSILVRDNGGAGLSWVNDSVALNDGNWHYVTFTRDSSQLDTLYRDGSFANSTTDAMTTGITDPNARIGSEAINGSITPFVGILDEIQISNVARSADWIKTEYNNQSNPAAFYTMGSATTNGSQYQVLNDGLGSLSGWAWNDEYGWISFCGGQNSANCPGSTVYETTIDSGGNFQGWAWNDLVGWFDFNCDNDSSCGKSNFEVLTSWTPSAASSTATLDSPTFDTGIASGAQFNSIGWMGGAAVGSPVQFQLAVSNSAGGPWNFIGTDGTSNTYYAPSAPGTPVNFSYSTFSGFRYFRYRVYLTYGNATSSRIDDVIVNWSP